MSQRAKRVWTAGVAGLPAAGVAIAALLVCQIHVNWARAEGAPAETGPEPLDPVTWSRVRELRERLRLSDGTLAAMACTQETAEGTRGIPDL